MESKFADNVAVYATTSEVMEQVAGEFEDCCRMEPHSKPGEDQAAHNGEAAEA